MPLRTGHPYYEMLDRCGQGGMGIVYRVRDTRLNRVVALKFLGPDQVSSSGAAARLQREAAAIAALNHPNVATLYEAGEWQGEPFIALEYLPGGTLKDGLPPTGLTHALCLRYAHQLGGGLAYAHGQGVIHRDIKPSNAMFSAHGDLKLVDFGLAKARTDAQLTNPGAVLGTGPYMAPEILEGHDATAQSDLYALGVVVYEMAAGGPPFKADTLPVLFQQILHARHKPLASLRPDLPKDFCETVDRSLAKDPRDRPKSVAEFLRLLGAPPSASGPSQDLESTETVVFPGAKPTRASAGAARLRKTALIGACVLALCLFLFAGVPRLLRRINPGTREATLVVLPFDYLGDDPASKALSDGIQETVTNMAARLRPDSVQLLVIPSTEVRRNQTKTIADARKLFHADLALNGTLQKAGESLQLTLTLADAASLRQKSSRVIVVPPAAAAELQSRLSEEIASLFGAERSNSKDLSQPGRTTANSEAYQHFLRGQGSLQNRELDAAVDELGKAVHLDPTFALARAKLAEAYARQNFASKDRKLLALADAELAEASRTAPDIPEVLLVQAMIRRATGDNNEAIRILEDLVSKDEHNLDARRALSTALGAAGRTAEAEQICLRTIRLRPSYAAVYGDLAIIYMANPRDYPKAERALLNGLEVAPENALLHLNLGALYFVMSRWEEAAPQFEKTLAIRPDPLAYNNLGTVRFYLGAYPESARQLEKAAKLQPANSFIWGGLADALLQIPGQQKRAQETYQKAVDLASDQLALNPTDATLRRAYALYLAHLNRVPEALRELGQALAQPPADVSSASYKAARVYVVSGNVDRALEALRQYVAAGGSLRAMQQEPDLAPLRNLESFKKLEAVHAP